MVVTLFLLTFTLSSFSRHPKAIMPQCLPTMAWQRLSPPTDLILEHKDWEALPNVWQHSQVNSVAAMWSQEAEQELWSCFGEEFHPVVAAHAGTNTFFFFFFKLDDICTFIIYSQVTSVFCFFGFFSHNLHILMSFDRSCLNYVVIKTWNRVHAHQCVMTHWRSWQHLEYLSLW